MYKNRVQEKKRQNGIQEIFQEIMTKNCPKVGLEGWLKW
jgi:hypothetical protein